MLIRWKSKDKSSSSQTTQGSNISAKKKRKGRDEEQEQRLQNDQLDERRRNTRRDDPRRHTLGGDILAYGSNNAISQQRALDLEMSTRNQKIKKGQTMRAYPSLSHGPLFDDDPGIMSEVETASTGFRRGGKQRSSLPVVRTPSKTLERPLGLVFLQYRSETKRALLPNEITSIDTVRALFVRSFPRQLTMAYLEGPNVKIYIHDANKDMFYELEDVRSHLREIRDRSVLRLFESTEVAAPPQILPGGSGVPQPLTHTTQLHWEQDQSYFSEPEFDSDYKNQHIHKTKIGKQAPYYVGTSQTLPRALYSSERNKVAMDGYTSSPERNTRGSYEEPYYSQYGTRGPTVASIIDEEQSELSLLEDQYALYGIKLPSGRVQRGNQIYDATRPEDLHRIRVEHMERQLANLTGLVQKALVSQNPQITQVTVPAVDPKYLVVQTQHIQANNNNGELFAREKAPKLGKNACQKSVSFEKSVSFSDDIQGLPKAHSPQHSADSKPTKPAIKSSTLPRTSSQERDRLKPVPPPKPIALTQTHPNYRPDIALAPEVYNHLRVLQKKAKDLRLEVRTLRRLSQAQSVAIREDIKGVFMRIRATLLASNGNFWTNQGDQEEMRISREEELYKQEVVRLEKDLSDLEASVETLRGEVINRRTRVNMTAVEDMALVLSRASKTVAELKLRFPALSNGMRCILTKEMEKAVREEKFLKEEPERLESALKRCKKLTGTLVTLKRLASVQEQRLPPNDNQPQELQRSAEVVTTDKPTSATRMGTHSVNGGSNQPPPENALDALLDELKTFSRPIKQNNELPEEDQISGPSIIIHSKIINQLTQTKTNNHNNTNNITDQSNIYKSDEDVILGQTLINKNHSSSIHLGSNPSTLRRLNSYPSGSDTDASPTPQHDQQRAMKKPPVPERTAELISKVSIKRVPPPPPPRTSSRSPLASPTTNLPYVLNMLNDKYVNEEINVSGTDISSSGNDSNSENLNRQVALEIRHQELLKKQKLLQEQYQKLQELNKNSNSDVYNSNLSKAPSETHIQNQIVLKLNNPSKFSEIEIDQTIPDRLTETSVNVKSGTQQNSLKSFNSQTAKIKQVYETEII